MLIKTVFELFSPAGARGKLSILIFHRVLSAPDPLFPGESDAARFDLVMSWVAQWFQVLPLDEAVRRLQAGELPACAAAITFNDDYADNYTELLPILQRHSLPATFFIATDFLDGGRMWNDTIIETVRGAKVDFLDAGVPGVEAAPIRNDAEKRSLLGKLIPAVKHLPPVVRQETVERIAELSQADLPDDLMLSTQQLRGLRQAGMLIGAHTLSHPILAKTGGAEAEHEIAASRDILENLLGEPVRLFAYPNGKPGSDYTRRDVDIVRRLGFEAAVSTSWGANTRNADPLQLPHFTSWEKQRWRYGARLLGNLQHAPVLALE